MRKRALRKAAALALVVGIATVARGTTIPVDSTADSLAVDGNCTLREAIIAANTDAAVDACPAGSGADVVVVPAGTYTLTLTGANEDAAASGDLDIPALPLAAPMRVQLVRLGAGPTCWEATFSTSTRNDAEVFRARSDP